MKRFLSLLLIMFVLSSVFVNVFTGYVFAATPGSLGDTNMKYEGRWDFSNSAEYDSYWCGAYVKVNFTGTTVKAKLGNTNDYYAKIDNGPWTIYSNASGTLNLTPTPLANGTHTLTLTVSRDFFYEFKFQGLILDSGATTSAPTMAANIIEFIGDSITCGCTCPYESVTSYPWLSAEGLGCEHTQISFPGICLVTGYGPNTAGQDTEYFKLQPLNYTNPPDWDFTKYTPKLIVINLGTNDNNASVPDSVFQSTYITFLTNIRAKFPNAEIFAMRTFMGYKASPTQAAVSARNSAGDSKVHYIDTTGWLTAPGDFSSDGVHPNQGGHAKATNLLEPILAPYLSGTVSSIPGKIESENYNAMNGILTESCSDTGATLDVGYTDAGDWMDYNVNVATAGTYNVDLRVAAPNAVANGIQLKKSDGTVLSTVNVPSTGGWQIWQTVTTSVPLSAGTQTIRVYVNSGAWNINWMNFTSNTTKYEAENGTLANGATVANDSAASNGQCIQNMHIANASCQINNINGGTGGSKTLNIVYAADAACTITLYVNGTSVGTLSCPTTGGWSTFTGNVQKTITLNSGTGNNIKIVGGQGGLNLDYITIQ